MDIVFKGRHTDVLERFRVHAMSKLSKIEKLDHKAMRVDVEVTTERNPRQSGRKERVELTITTRGPAIRAEAAAEDRFSALDLALAKLESRLRRACDRRKGHYAAAGRSEVGGEPVMEIDLDTEPGRPDEPVPAGPAEGPAGLAFAGAVPASRTAPEAAAGAPDSEAETIIRIEVEGDGPLVVREKTHVASPMTVDQALFEMELVGHDFFLFTDTGAGLPSVVYRRRGYEYGVIRLVADAAAADSAGLANGAVRRAANLATG
ncbi:MAG TPA: ribosome-associated translation inhibitor RaiA [Streptosporangiaceae bacterium]|nr:ribosome-associated translation inhibitor RaiA [Streptosporangiaceae bacterium]